MKSYPHVWLVALAAMLCSAWGAPIALSSEATIEYVRTSSGYQSVGRHYIAGLPGETRTFRFTASHTIGIKLVDPRDWTLSLQGEWVEPEDVNLTGMQRRAAMEEANLDPFASSEIVGENGLLFQCIRKLREDVPDARIDGISLDMRCYYESWPELRKLLVPFVKKMGDSGTIMGPPGGSHVAYAYVSHARQTVEIANRVAQWTDTRFDRIVWDHDHGLRTRLDFIGKPASVLLEDRHLGLDISSVSFEFLFKPKEPAKSGKPGKKR